MDANQFDRITCGLISHRSRRELFGGLLAGAAALSGATALELEAKNGKGKGKGKGKGHGKGHGKGKGKGKNKGKNNGKGKGRTKVSLCHFVGEEQGYNFLILGAPGAANHDKHHEEDVLCEPEACQVATGCDAAVVGICTFEPAAAGTACAVDDVAGTCDDAGTCVAETA